MVKSKPSPNLSEQDISNILNSPPKITKRMNASKKETTKNMKIRFGKKILTNDSFIDLVDSDIEDDDGNEGSLSEIVVDQSVKPKKRAPLTKPLKVNVMRFKEPSNAHDSLHSPSNSKKNVSKAENLTTDEEVIEVSKAKMNELISENEKLRDELVSVKSKLGSLEYKVPQMIEEFKKELHKQEEKSTKMKQELVGLRKQAKSEEDINDKSNLKALLEAAEAKLKSKEKEVANVSRKSIEAAKNIKLKESQLEDANKKIRKLQEEVKQKPQGKSKAHQEQNDTIKKFEKDIDLKMRELSVVSNRLSKLEKDNNKLEKEKIDNGKQIQKQSQIISDLTQKFKIGQKDLEEVKSKRKICEDKCKRLEAENSSINKSSKSFRDEIKKSNEELKKKCKTVEDLQKKLSKEEGINAEKLKEIDEINKSRTDEYTRKIDALQLRLIEEEELTKNLKLKNLEQQSSLEKTRTDVKDLNDSFKKEQRKIILEYSEKLESKDLLLREKALEHSEKLSKVYQKVEEKDLLIMELKSNVLEFKLQISDKDIEIRKHISRIHEIRREFEKEIEAMKFGEINRANNIRHEMLLQQKDLRDKLVNDHEAALSSLKLRHQEQISRVQEEMASKVEKKRQLLRKVVQVVNYKKMSDVGSEANKVKGSNIPVSYNWPLVRASVQIQEFAVTNICKEILQEFVSIFLSGFQFPQLRDYKRGIKRKQKFNDDCSSKKLKIKANERLHMLSYCWPLVLYKPPKVPKIISIHSCLKTWPILIELPPAFSIKKKMNENVFSEKKMLQGGSGNFRELLPAVTTNAAGFHISSLVTIPKKRKADLEWFEDLKVKEFKRSIFSSNFLGGIKRNMLDIEESEGEPLVKRMRFTNDLKRDMASIIHHIVDGL